MTVRCILLRKSSIEVAKWRNKMFRLALYIFGISSCAAALLAYKGQMDAKRPIPVKEAAAKLQKAWADSHTYV